MCDGIFNNHFILNLLSKIFRWKNFENCSIFSKVMVSSFLKHPLGVPVNSDRGRSLFPCSSSATASPLSEDRIAIKRTKVINFLLQMIQSTTSQFSVQIFFQYNYRALKLSFCDNFIFVWIFNDAAITSSLSSVILMLVVCISAVFL